MNKPTPPAAKPRNDININEGEGSRTAARHYNDQTRAFVDAGKVEAAAKAAVKALDGDEADALARAEEVGKSKARE